MVNNKENKYLIYPFLLGLLMAATYFVLPNKYMLALLLGIVGGSLILKDLRIGLMLGVLAYPFLPDMVSLLYMLGLSLAYLYTDIFVKRKELRSLSIEIPIVLYIFIMVYSTITSSNPGGSLRDLALHLGGISFMFTMVNTVETKNDFNRIVSFFVMAASLIALHGLYQYIVGIDIDMSVWIDSSNNPDIKARVYSVFYNPNIMAEYLILATPMAVALFWDTKRLDKKLIFLGSSLFMLIAIVLTFSRGGWVGISFAALVFIILVEKRLLLSIIPISIGAVYLLPQTVIARILSIGNLSDSSNAYRLKLWSLTKELISDNLAAGVGLGYIAFRDNYLKYTRTLVTAHAHNTYLQIAAEMGIPGLIIFLVMMFNIFKYGILRLNRSEDPYIRTLGAGAVASLAGIMAHGIVENILYMPRIIFTFWIIIGFIFTLIKLEDKRKLEE